MMAGTQLSLDTIGFNAAIACCSHCSLWALTLLLCSDMASRNIASDITTYRQSLMEAEQQGSSSQEQVLLRRFGSAIFIESDLVDKSILMPAGTPRRSLTS